MTDERDEVCCKADLLEGLSCLLGAGSTGGQPGDVFAEVCLHRLQRHRLYWSDASPREQAAP